MKKDEYSLRSLIMEYNKSPNIYLLSYVFAIKLKQNQFESLAFLISEIPNMNPVLKFYYYVKVSSKLTMTTTVESVLNEVSSISELTNSQKADILFFYGMYLVEKKRFRHALRFYRMSSTFSKKEERTSRDGLNEVSKLLFILGQKKKACEIFNEKPKVSSESDEVLYIYCNRKNQLNFLSRSIKTLMVKEKNVFYKKILAEIKTK